MMPGSKDASSPAVGAANALAPSAEQKAACAKVRRVIPSDAQEAGYLAADGWRLRHLIWPAPDHDRGSMLFLGGRGDHYEKYLETFAYWRLQGWRVESVDWRGQGGSGRTTANANVGHIDDFATWLDDIAQFCADWVQRTPGPHVVAAHSMGGHLIVRALADRRIDVDAAILVAPMLGFTAPYPDRMGLWIANIMCALGSPERAAWKASEKPGSSLRLRQKLLTHDDARYQDEVWWHSERPDVMLGPASWGWVRAAYRSFLHIRTAGLLEAVTTPCLFLSTVVDKLVSCSAIRRDAGRIPGARLHVYGPDAAHELLREKDKVRDDALARIDAFLEDVLTS